MQPSSLYSCGQVDSNADYIRCGSRQAHYEIMENGRFFGSIPVCRGAWREGATLEECREEPAAAFEAWIVVGRRHGDTPPVINGIDLNLGEYAEPHQMA